MEEGKKWDLISAASIPLIMTLGNSMLIPILPAIQSKLHVTSFQVSLLITIYSAVAIVLIPIAGFLSDRFGRKKVIIPSLIITGIGGLISGVAAWMLNESYWLIMTGRLIQGIGAAGSFPIVLPLVGDIFKKESDVSSGLGVIETANTFGKVLSPILGSALAALVWYLPFLTIPVLCLFSMMLVLFLVKVPKTQSRQKQTDPSFPQFIHLIKDIFRKKGRWLYAIFTIGGICMFVIFAALFYLSETLENIHHIKGILKGCLLAIPLAVLCMASFIAGKTIGKNKKLMKWVIFFGIVVVSGSLVICGRVHSMAALIAWFSLAGLGIGVSLPCLDALITEGIEKAERGTITSIYSSTRFIGVAVGPPVASLLITFSPEVLFYVLSGSCLVAAALSFFAITPRNSTQATNK